MVRRRSESFRRRADKDVLSLSEDEEGDNEEDDEVPAKDEKCGLKEDDVSDDDDKKLEKDGDKRFVVVTSCEGLGLFRKPELMKLERRLPLKLEVDGAENEVLRGVENEEVDGGEKVENGEE